MKRLLYIVFVLAFCIASCVREEDDLPVPPPTEEPGDGTPTDPGEENPSDTEKTILLYLPWSGNLTSYFRTNIADFEKAIQKGILQSERVLVFFATSTSEASLFELVYDKGQVTRVPIQTYVTPVFTTASGITSLLPDVKEAAPANHYSLIIGAHGMGWIPVNQSTRARSIAPGPKLYWEYEGGPQTRYFGATSKQYQTDISELAAGISGAKMNMEYILFDDCYMSSIEVAYDLRQVAKHLIGSPTEMMAYGMPYADIASYLLGSTDYESICNAFLTFYQGYTEMPCGTLGVTVSSEVDALATIMKEINSRYTFDTSLTGTVQRMDGYTATVFFDCGDYVAKLCPDITLLGRFEAQLNRTVKYRTHTDYYYSASAGKRIKIDTFSGTTISDPSTSSLASAKEETSWYKKLF